MLLSSHKWVFAAGAAALLSSQAASASVPINTIPSVDPLVSVSLFGTSTSRAEVMASPAVAAPAVAGAAATTAAVQPGDQGYGLDWAGLFVLFAVPVAITLAIALQDKGNGNFTSPLSPP
jgi:hypothetical protein